jgi:hypothetical protein
MSALFEIEDDIRSIQAAARLLGHLTASRMEIKHEELEAIRGMIENYIDDIECRWKEALDQELATRKAHEEALAAARAEKAAPGSPEDVQYVRALRAMLRSAATIALAECNKGGGHRIAETQGPRQRRSAASGKTRPSRNDALA